MLKTVDTIDNKHKDYAKFLPRWQTVNDICDGENLRKYLRWLNPTDNSQENVARNKEYFEGAVFSEISGFTLNGMVGMVFRKDPKVSLPPALEYLKKNCDGMGTSIYQQSQNTVASIIKTGRAGLWVNFPQMVDIDGNNIVSSKKDLENLLVYATINRYEAHQILDWELEKIGASIKLSNITIFDTITKGGKDINTILELALLDGVYVTRVWEETDSGWQDGPVTIPVDGKGNKWNRIPFTFVGSKTNTFTVDKPPLEGITRINIGHFNNSAEYEDMCQICSQAQSWMSGLTQEHVDMLRANNMYFGSNQLLSVPAGEKFGIEQAKPNSVAKEAMDSKVEQAVGLGAMYIQPGSAVRTEAEVLGAQQVQHSVLSLIAANCSEAYTQACEWAARFMDVDSIEEIGYTLQQDFVPERADPQMYQQIAASWMAGLLPKSDAIVWQQKHGLIDPEKTLEEVYEELGEQVNTDLNYEEEES